MVRKIMMGNGNDSKTREAFLAMSTDAKASEIQDISLLQTCEIVDTELHIFSNVFNPDYLPSVVLALKAKPLGYRSLHDDEDINVQLPTADNVSASDNSNIFSTTLYRLDESQLVSAIQGGFANVGSGFSFKLAKELKGQQFERETSAEIHTLVLSDDKTFSMISDKTPGHVNSALLEQTFDVSDDDYLSKLRGVIDVSLNNVEVNRSSELASDIPAVSATPNLETVRQRDLSDATLHVSKPEPVVADEQTPALDVEENENIELPKVSLDTDPDLNDEPDLVEQTTAESTSDPSLLDSDQLSILMRDESDKNYAEELRKRKEELDANTVLNLSLIHI